MIQIIDPRKGDAEDDASSTKRRSLFALAGSLVAEISLPKLVLAWVLLIGLPGFVLGMVPLVVSAWLGKVSTHASAFFTGISYFVIVLVLAVLGWLGGKPAFRLFENSFWSLQALGIQPAYAICREALRHLLEGFLPSGIATAKRNTIRAAGAAMSGLLIGAAAFGLAAAAWPASRWVGRESRRPRVTPPSRADRICKCGRHHRHLLCHRGPRVGHRRCGNGPTAGFVLLRDVL